MSQRTAIDDMMMQRHARAELLANLEAIKHGLEMALQFVAATAEYLHGEEQLEANEVLARPIKDLA